jgi:hypothetical protein
MALITMDVTVMRDRPFERITEQGEHTQRAPDGILEPPVKMPGEKTILVNPCFRELDQMIPGPRRAGGPGADTLKPAAFRAASTRPPAASLESVMTEGVRTAGLNHALKYW